MALAVGDATALEVENVLAEATAELEEDPGLPDASLAHDSDDLAAALADPFQRLTEMRQLSLPTHERRQLGREIDAGAPLPEARHLVGDDERLLALDRAGAGRARKVNAPAVSRRVASLTRTAPGWHACSRRAARLTVSP